MSNTMLFSCRRVLLLAVVLVFAGSVGVAQEKDNGTEEANQERSRGNGDDGRRVDVPPSGKMIQPAWKKEPLENVLGDLQTLSGTSLQLSEDVDPNLEVDYVSPVPLYWRDVLDRVLQNHGLMAQRINSNQLRVTRPERVTMEIRESQFTSIVQTLAKIAGVSIIVSPKVAEKNVTIPSLTLRDVPWQSALDTVVKTAGFASVREKFGIIRVITIEELKQQLETRTYQLKYLRPPTNYKGKVETPYMEKASEQNQGGDDEGPYSWELLNVLASVITKSDGEPIGTLQYDAKRNILIVQDTPDVLQKIESMLEILDTEPPQVLIQVRFISTTNRFLRDLGVEFRPLGRSQSLTNNQNFQSDLAQSTAQTTQTQPQDVVTRLPFGLGGAVNNQGSVRPFLSDFALDFVIRMFQQDEASRIVQSPKLTVVDGHQATVFVGRTERFGTIETDSATGSTTVTQSVEEASFSPVNTGFQLFVVPHVVRGTDRVMLTVIPTNNILEQQNNNITINQGGFQTTVPFPITSSSTVVTRLILKSGTTAVLAGLVGQNDTSTRKKIPFFGDIPVLGRLFSAEGTQEEESFDFFFITAYILPSVEEHRRELLQRMNERSNQLGKKYEEMKNQDGQLKEQLKERKQENLEEYEKMKKSGGK